MCEHEGRECPGRGCRCDCMDCPGHGSKDDYDPYEEEDPIYLSELYSSEMENPL